MARMVDSLRLYFEHERHSLTLLLLLLCALAIRGYIMLFTYVIARDGIIYLSIAKSLASGNWTQALSFDFPPGFPALVALNLHIFSPERAGQVISLIFGSLAVVPLYFLASRMLGKRVAIVTSLFFVFHPYFVRLSGEVLSDMTYLFLFMMGAWLIWEAINRNVLTLFPLIGLLGALAYLVRPEGMGLIIVAGSFIAFKDLKKIRRDLWRRLAAILLLVSVVVLMAAPYLAYMKKESGSWVLSKKGSVEALIGLKKTPPPPEYSERGYWRGFFYKFVHKYHILLMMLFLFGLYRRFRSPGWSRPEVFLGVFWGLYLFVLWRHFVTYGYVSYRHFMPLVALSLPFAAFGLMETSSLIARKLATWRSFLADPSQKVLACLIILVLLILSFKAMKPQRADKMPLREAGSYIKEQGMSNPLIMSTDPRVAFYAEGRALPIDNKFLSGKNVTGEIGITHRLLPQAINQRVQFIMLNGQLTPEIADQIRANSSVAMVTMWGGDRAKKYTLITISSR